MPGQTDLYFPPEDSQFEVAHAQRQIHPVRFRIWGHAAGGPGTNPEDVKLLGRQAEALSSLSS